MGTIVTFYSYKGGVGRSMALANVALLLAQQGLRVLVVDWDLEAPGIERYFSYFETSAGGPGLLRMLIDARKQPTCDYRKYTSSIGSETKYPVTLLGSGRDQDEEYSANLESFDWGEFFAGGGGDFIEELRDRWREHFDLVLIDSRTGLSDAGGVCTIQLPDVVVAMFTANYQSLYGVRDVIRLAQQARQKLAYDRMPLSVLALPSRWGVGEFQETRVWLDRVVEGVQEFFEDWLPRPLTARDVLESVKIPHHSYFGFGERMAVVEQGTSDPQGMGFVYARVASFLASGFRDIGALLGDEMAERAASHPKSLSVPTPPISPKVPSYEYDIFVSYDHSVIEWTHEFVEDLRKELEARSPTPITIFMDARELEPGSNFQQHIRHAIARSKVFLPIITPRYATSAWTRAEYEFFKQQNLNEQRGAIFPVLLRGELPAFTRDVMAVDFRKFALHKAARASQLSEWWRKLDSLASDIIDRIREISANRT